jgi:phosphoribosylformylglycinamidine cyclo-ligase
MRVMMNAVIGPPDRGRPDGNSAERAPRIEASRRAPYTRVLSTTPHSYAAAGVSLAVADAVVERLRAAVESTGATNFGAFAGLHPLDDRRFLAASTDGVGTKLMLARARGALRACGADLAAHCINDVLTTGATPLLLLDYVAAERIELEEVAELVEGAAEVCRQAGVALVGGETAELPGIYRDGELDFAGTCVGVVDRNELVDGASVEPGDTVIGFPSAGVHANGFTLVRRVLDEEDYDGDDLLAPTRLYLAEARALRGRAHAFAHVTGGGILGNLRRVVPAGREIELDWDAWTRPPVFAWLARHVAEDELRRVFNLGIGWCAVVANPAPGELVIGRIV